MREQRDTGRAFPDTIRERKNASAYDTSIAPRTRCYERLTVFCARSGVAACVRIGGWALPGSSRCPGRRIAGLKAAVVRSDRYRLA